MLFPVAFAHIIPSAKMLRITEIYAGDLALVMIKD